MQKVNINDLGLFVSQYVKALYASGAYISRVNHCTQRLVRAYGYEISLNYFYNNIAFTISDPQNRSNKETMVFSNDPVQIDLRLLSDLSALSWEIHDNLVPLSKAFEYLNRLKIPRKRLKFIEFFIIALAFGAFCKVFGGDFNSCLLTAISAFLGAYLRHFCVLKKIDPRIWHLFLAFFSSSLLALGAQILPTQTLHIGLATSTLYLVPGIFFLNSMIDILDYHVLVGISRFVNVFILITCMAIGVYITLMVFGIGILP